MDAPTHDSSAGPTSTSEVSPKDKGISSPSAPGSIGPLQAGLLSLPTLQEQQQHQRQVPPLSSFPLSLHLPLPVAPAVTGSSSGAGAGIDRFLSPSVAHTALPPPIDGALAVSVAAAPVSSSSQANSSSALVGAGASIGVDGAHLPYHIYFGAPPVGSGLEDTVPSPSATPATAGCPIGGSGLGAGFGAGSALPSIASTVAAAAGFSSADHFRLVHAETTVAASSAEFDEPLEASVPTPAAMDLVSSPSSFCRLEGHQQEQHRQQQPQQQQRQPEQEDPEVERPETPPPVSEVEMKGNAPWTAEEDERLRQAARRHSLKHWKKIARFVGGEEE